MVVLRLLHILGGVTWVGTVFSMVLFVGPATRAAGIGAIAAWVASLGPGIMVMVTQIAVLLAVAVTCMASFRYV